MHFGLKILLLSCHFLQEMQDVETVSIARQRKGAGTSAIATRVPSYSPIGPLQMLRLLKSGSDRLIHCNTATKVRTSA